MKLLNCRVQNFGTLSGYNLSFSDGLTAIKEENGFGKTTLASFIKAMFYGLPQTSKRNLDENDRKKYTPWQGGTFGGSLDFEIEGKKYRIERIFAVKEKDDSFKLFDLSTNSVSSDYSENIGVELFGIDSESFERSIYMPQTDAEASMSNSIRAKLTGLVENSDDISNFDTAVKALEKRARFYSLSRGVGGAISEVENEISRLEGLKNDAVAASDNLERINYELKENEQLLQELIEKQSVVRNSITAVSDAAARNIEAKQKQELLSENEALLSKHEDLLKHYPNGLPLEEMVIKAVDVNNSLAETLTEISYLKSHTTVRDELDDLSEFFNGTVPQDDEVKTAKEKAARLTMLESRLESIKGLVDNQEPSSESKSSKVKVFILAAAMLIALGIGGMFINLLVGIILLVFGVLSLFVSAFSYLKNMISESKNTTDNPKALRDEYNSLSAEIYQIKQSVSGFVGRYIDGEELVPSLEVISENLRDYKRLRLNVAEQDKRLEQRLNVSEELRIRLLQFFEKYGVGYEGSFADRIDNIKNDIREKKRLEDELKNIKERLEQLVDVKIEQSNIEIADREELIETEKVLNLRLNELTNIISNLRSDANKLRDKAHSVADIEEALENAQDKRAEMTEKLDIINKTLELLKKAKTELSSRYLDKMTNGFDKYFEIITGQKKDQSMIDTDLNISLNEGGLSRDKDYFSKGYKDMLDIAMRLALTDALYEKEKPILILDDPFVNLDDRRIKNALELLKRLAAERQIVYLTCHSSRL